MGPIEVLWFAVVLFFVFVALVRGYPRELGVTTVIFAALFLIHFFFGRYFDALLQPVLDVLNISPTARGLEHFKATFYSLVFLLIVFSGYAGQTFTFQGKERKGTDGLVLNLLVGLLNGYLVAGTLWYFQHAFNYPIADFKGPDGRPLIFTMPLSPLAQQLVKILPLAVVPDILWGGLLMLMLLARVRR